MIFKCDQYYDEHPEFVPTQKVGRVFGVDENAKEFVIYTGVYNGLANIQKFKFSQLISFELIEDLGSYKKEVFYGVADKNGLVYGSLAPNKEVPKCKKLFINLTLNSFDFPMAIIELYNGKSLLKTSDDFAVIYRDAQHILSLLQLICDSSADEPVLENKTSSSLDPYEELKKLKELLDLGTVTQEEFDQKKKKLLDL